MPGPNPYNTKGPKTSYGISKQSMNRKKGKGKSIEDVIYKEKLKAPKKGMKKGGRA